MSGNYGLPFRFGYHGEMQSWLFGWHAEEYLNMCQGIRELIMDQMKGDLSQYTFRLWLERNRMLLNIWNVA